MDKQLLVDYTVFEVTPQAINESLSQNNGKLIVSGVLQRAESKNQNGRIYPKETLMREAKKYSNEFIQERRALGELDHPDSSVVNLNNVCHIMKKVWWEGNEVHGTCEILPTPAGNILKALFAAGVTVGISSRGMGSVETVTEDNGGQSQEVQDDFELIAFDFVSNPSTHGAFMYPTGVNESVDKTITSGRTCGEYCKVESIINDIMRGN